MTINLADNDPRVSYSVAEGVTQTSFTVSFEFFDEEDLNVYVDGTLKTLTTDYTVTGGDGSTGSVSISVTGASGGSTVVVTRSIDLERTTDFPTSGAFNISALNTELDRLVAINADLKDSVDRSLKLADYDTASSLTIPELEDRKGTVLGFNVTNGNVEAGPKIADVSSLAAITADISRLADIEDGTDATDAIQTAASISSDISTVSGISANVTTVAGISSDVTAVAGDAIDIGTVSTNISNVNTVAGISGNVTTVAGISADVIAVAGDATDIGVVSTNIADVNTAASNITDIQNASANAATATTKAAEAATSASNAATSETNSATSAANSATSAASSATSASNAATSETNAATSATAAAASQAAAAASAASAASAFDNFDDTYLGSKTSDPTVDNDGDPLTSGDLYFNSTANEMRVYDGANWIAATSAGNVSLLNYNYTATSGQTTFSGADDNAATLSYTQQNLIVTLNGVVLEDGTDYTANNGTSIVLASGAALNDELNVISFKSFTTADMVPASTGGTFSGNVAITGDLTVDTNTLYVDSTNNRVGIGLTPSKKLDVDTTMRVTNASGTSAAELDVSSGSTWRFRAQPTTGTNAYGLDIVRGSAGTDVKMSIDSSGNLLVGTTNVNIRDSSTTDGLVYRTGNSLDVTNNGNTVAIFNRNTSDGEIVTFRKGAADVGSIGVVASNNLYVHGDNIGLGIGDDNLYATNASGASNDNAVDLGDPSVRWDDVYATNGTIQTSDRNEKQQIASLTDVEMTAAKAISKLFKTFKWNDSVAEKGDAARTHTGVIAQEVEQAMTDAGLNAGDYAFFISTTWWETQTEVPAVEADEENGVEAQEAYTRTDTYETAEEAPEGATERNRKGIRYPQLLSFIGAATEQRLASIETRLDALEAN